jgi:uncharacterized protein (DUF2249 family)
MPTTDSHDLDVRSLPPGRRHAAIFERFDALAEGDGFVLVNDHEPRPLYYEFRAERPGRFQWTPISAAPGEVRVEITRLPPKEEETTISAYFERDHDEIDTIYGFLRRDLDGDVRNAVSLAALYDEFSVRLERHIRWEEEILFPGVEEKMPHLAEGPGRVMRLEHVDIRKLKGSAGTIFHQTSPKPDAFDAAAGLLDAMASVLIDHNRKEEAVYYPMADQVFGRGEAAELLRRVREMK